MTDIESLLSGLVRAVERQVPALQSAAYLHLARSLPLWQARAATYFALFRVADIERAVVGNAFADEFGAVVESAMIHRSAEALADACSSWRMRLAEKTREEGFVSEVAEELICLLDGLIDEQPAVRVDENGDEFSGVGCESSIIGLVESTLGLRDQESVLPIGFVDGVWVLSAICDRAQWRVLEALWQSDDWERCLAVAKCVSRSARSKYRPFLSAREGTWMIETSLSPRQTRT